MQTKKKPSLRRLFNNIYNCLLTLRTNILGSGPFREHMAAVSTSRLLS
jgi:hypothetical protein